jgi:hypothetical protein
MALVLVGGVILWGVPWFVWPSGLSAGKGERRTPPVFRYIRATQGLDGSTWSPVLMPLPTPDGFSKKAALKESPNRSLVSVLKPKISAPVYMTLDSGVSARSGFQSVSVLRPVEFDPEVSYSTSLKKERGDEDTIFRFEIPESFRYRHFEVPNLSLVTSNSVDWPAISVTAAVEIDKQGFVQHVMLEQPSGIPFVDSLIVRGLRGGHGLPGPSNTWGRVKFFCWKNRAVRKE